MKDVIAHLQPLHHRLGVTAVGKRMRVDKPDGISPTVNYGNVGCEIEPTNLMEVTVGYLHVIKRGIQLRILELQPVLCTRKRDPFCVTSYQSWVVIAWRHNTHEQ